MSATSSGTAWSQTFSGLLESEVAPESGFLGGYSPGFSSRLDFRRILRKFQVRPLPLPIPQPSGHRSTNRHALGNREVLADEILRVLAVEEATA